MNEKCHSCSYLRHGWDVEKSRRYAYCGNPLGQLMKEKCEEYVEYGSNDDKSSDMERAMNDFAATFEDAIREALRPVARYFEKKF